MISSGFRSTWIALILGLSVSLCPAKAVGATPDLLEVYGLIRSNLTGVTQAEVDRRATEALISEFGPQVTLSGEGSTGGSEAVANPAAILKATVIDESFAYIRLGTLSEGAAKELKSAFDRLAKTNRLKGMALDLRYTVGQDFAAAAAAADLFIPKARTLLTWSQNSASSSAKTDAITLPVAVLVNRKTAGGPEAMAAVMRFAGVGLIIGSQTAGQAVTKAGFPLSNGQTLQIANSPVLLGDGTPVSAKGVIPDIQVQVRSADELVYFKDPFAVLASGATNESLLASGQPASTNRVSRRRYSEAELARERREATNGPDAPRVLEPDKPSINDPVLARALDLLKGLAVVKAR